MPKKPTATQILIAANIVALGALAVVKLSPYASAQGFRLRSTYSAASGRIPGTETHAVYIVDESTQELLSLQWDPRSKQLQMLGYRNLMGDAAEALRPRGN
jgi:hypothetical protein